MTAELQLVICIKYLFTSNEVSSSLIVCYLNINFDDTEARQEHNGSNSLPLQSSIRGFVCLFARQSADSLVSRWMSEDPIRAFPSI